MIANWRPARLRRSRVVRPSGTGASFTALPATNARHSAAGFFPARHGQTHRMRGPRAVIYDRFPRLVVVPAPCLALACSAACAGHGGLCDGSGADVLLDIAEYRRPPRHGGRPDVARAGTAGHARGRFGRMAADTPRIPPAGRAAVRSAGTTRALSARTRGLVCLAFAAVLRAALQPD